MTGGVCARVRERATFQLISTTLRAFPSKTETRQGRQNAVSWIHTKSNTVS